MSPITRVTKLSPHFITLFIILYSCNQNVTTLSQKVGLRLKTEKEKCPIHLKLGIFSLTKTTICDSGAKMRKENPQCRCGFFVYPIRNPTKVLHQSAKSESVLETKRQPRNSRLPLLHFLSPTAEGLGLANSPTPRIR